MVHEEAWCAVEMWVLKHIEEVWMGLLNMATPVRDGSRCANVNARRPISHIASNGGRGTLPFLLGQVFKCVRITSLPGSSLKASATWNGEACSSETIHKIWILSRQLVFELLTLPSSVQVYKSHGLSKSACSLCGMMEDASHILFYCALAKFIRRLLSFFLGVSEIPTTSENSWLSLRILCVSQDLCFGCLFAQSWDLCHIKNKLAIEFKYPIHSVDCTFKILIFL
jgi:hypothetical protein